MILNELGAVLVLFGVVHTALANCRPVTMQPEEIVRRIVPNALPARGRQPVDSVAASPCLQRVPKSRDFDSRFGGRNSHVVVSAHLVSLLTGARVNQRMRNKICGRQGSDLRVDLVAAMRVSLTARHTLHFDGVGRLQDVMDRRTIRPKEVKEDGTLAPGGFAVDDPINIVGHAASFFPSQASVRE